MEITINAKLANNQRAMQAIEQIKETLKSAGATVTQFDYEGGMFEDEQDSKED